MEKSVPPGKNIRFLIISFFILSLSFLLCYLFFAWYSRFTADDYSLMALHRKLGLFRFPVWFYMNQEGCFAGWMYSTLMIKFLLFFSRPFVYLVCFLSLSAFCLFRASRNFMGKYFGERGFLVNAFICMLLLSSLYMTSYGVAEIFYWPVGSGYLVYGSLFIYNLSIFLTTENKWHLRMTYAGFFLFGMSRLNYVCIAGVMLGCYSLFNLIINRKWEHKYFWAILLLGVGLILYVIAPGNYVRRGSSSLPHVNTLLLGSLKIFLHFFKTKILKLPIYLCFTFPAFFISQFLRQKIRKIYSNIRQLLVSQIYLTVLFIIMVVVNSVVMAVAEGEVAHDRVNLLLDLFFIAWLANLFLHLGAYLSFRFNLILLLPLFSLVSAGLFVHRISNYRASAIDKAFADDARVGLIQKMKANQHASPIDTLFLEPLPKCGMLYDWDLTKLNGKPTWIGLNNGLMMYYETSFKIDSGYTHVSPSLTTPTRINK